MKQTIFTGMATAMVTPMTPEGVDYEALGRFVDFQLSQGIHALVAVGTTGESATLSPDERKEVIRFTIDRVAGRVPVIAGTGTNNTQHAIEYSVDAAKAGADALLVVTPYYNKATQNGLIAHFTAIADKVDKPIILYNVPSRTGCNLLPKTCAVLAEHPRIAAIKEASGDLSQVAELARLVEGKMDIYSGNDDQIVPILSLGGKGVISVLSNLLPAETQSICDRFLAGDVAGSRRMQLQYLPLIHALFSEVNPIPVKAAMAHMGYGENYLRLPLTPMEPENEAVLLQEMRAQGTQ